jgi:hypothetical protein
MGTSGMRLLLCATVVLLTGCAEQRFTEQPMTAADMPVSLDMPGLSASPPRFHRMYDSGRGTDIRQMVMAGGTKFAVVSYVSTTGAYVLPERSTRSWVDTMLPEDASPNWGASGSASGSANWQAFDMQDRRCVGVTKETSWHPEAGGVRSATRGMVVAIYCRPGIEPLRQAEALQVASALHMKS